VALARDRTGWCAGWLPQRPPRDLKPQRIAENLDVFDFDLATDELAAIDARDTGQRGGPEPEVITLESFGRPIPED
jgi:diketogulonate reductase-like aldo/keto reductase